MFANAYKYFLLIIVDSKWLLTESAEY